MRIGFVGLGRMGQAMAPRLLDAGHTLTVWNRTPAKAMPLVERGAALADSLPNLPQHCDVICTILTNDAAVEAVYHPDNGLLAGEVRGTVLVEMSTIRPDTIHHLAALAAERGASLLDSPVSGTVEPARAGQLIALVGGDKAALERARPLLEVLCRRIDHLGPSGSGTTMKLVLNMPMAVYWQGLAEALSLGVRAGLDLGQMLDLIADSPAALGALRAKLPVIKGEEGDVAFDVTGVRKDLVAMVGTGQRHSVPMPAGSAALMAFAAATAAGWGERDLAALIPYYIDMVQRSTGDTISG